MTKRVETAFLLEPVTLKLEKISPTRKLSDGIKQTPRYQTVAASIKEVGIIEPPIVYPEKGSRGMYLMLDGHVRLEVLRELGHKEVLCLVSKDDENCTYNHKVSRIAPIQEDRMIRKAIAAGVPEARIAKALNLSENTIRRTRTRLNGICAEAIELLKDKPVADAALNVMKKVKAYRQIEMAELMIAANRYSGPYANALVINTPKELFVNPESKQKLPRAADLAKMEHEMQSLERDFVVLNESYGRNVMELTLARGYVKKLLDNAKVVKFLAQRKPDLLGSLQQVVEASSLEA
ncbi:MAG TPA: plasmid partitioning protein RepB C-terminal domain-containing protein [Polyangiaceae bacterium]|nr:plasmid partitioning protein RepB C-terminal domain-containing protein [Polyangiaceae bacterium]